jgi:hypothetical protein
LVLWIVRVPVTTTVFGWLLLGATPQAQDLFTAFLDLSWWTLFQMFLFVLVLTAVRALPTHYAARMLVDSDPKAPTSSGVVCLEKSAIWVPRLLGFLTFAAVEFAVWRSHANLPTLDEGNVKQDVERALIAMAVLVAGGAVAYSVWVVRRPRNFKLTGLLGRLIAILVVFWQAVSPGRVRGSAIEQGRDIGRLVLAGVFVVFLAIFLFGADQVARFFQRAMAVPFILGGWLPFLSYVSAVGRQIRAPLLTGLIALVVVLAAVLGDNHSVRRVASNGLRQVPIEELVDLWMTENGCNPKRGGGAAVTSCPRPIIVAAAGGASRAAFMMASTIGYFLDTSEAANYGVRGLNAKDTRNRIFAISSVSGGSMGAVMVTAAFNATSSGGTDHPCVKRSVDQWWGREVGKLARLLRSAHKRRFPHGRFLRLCLQ